ncbi:hypothetical protein HDU97_007448 [Phlyctochytrium planicorne]|nr:hypothetical protein HDU97_007448 [Phlyctochytrium planicorne]
MHASILIFLLPLLPSPSLCQQSPSQATLATTTRSLGSTSTLFSPTSTATTASSEGGPQNPNSAPPGFRLPDNLIQLGAKYNVYSDSSSRINNRLKSKEGGSSFTGLSLFAVQAMIYSSDRVQNIYWDILNVTKTAIQHLDETGTDAMVMISVAAPFKYWNNSSLIGTVPPEFGEAIAAVVRSGRKVLLDLFPAMNKIQGEGTFIQPADFTSTYRRFRNVTLDAIPPSNRSSISFVWSPSCFVDRAGIDAISSSKVSANTFRALDVTGDGIVDKYDDPYFPYYPGDLNVNYVGCDILPEERGLDEPSLDSLTIEQTLGKGFNDWSLYKSYSNQNRPFIITSLGIPYTFPTSSQSQVRPKQSRRSLKQWLYNQVNGPSLLSSFPNLRIVTFTEFFFMDGTTATDYGNTGCSPDLVPFCKESEADITVEDFLDMMGTDGFGYANDTRGNRPLNGPDRKTNSSRRPSQKPNWVIIGSITGTAAVLIMAAGGVLAHRWRNQRNQKASTKALSNDFELDVSTGKPSTDTTSALSNSSSTPTSDPSTPKTFPTTTTTTTTTTPIRSPTPDKRDLPSTLFTQLDPPTPTQNSTSEPPEKQSTLFSSLTSPSITVLESLDEPITPEKEKSPTQSDPPAPEHLTWSTTRVKRFLLDSGVSPSLADILEANGITGYKLLLLSHQSLQEMGVELLAARNLILFVASQLRDGGSSSGSAEAGAGGGVAAAGEGDAPPEYTH